MALVLIMLLIGFFFSNELFYKLAIPVLVINMIVPRIYYPFAILWFGLSNLLGSVISRILLSVVYFIFLVPVGLIRRLLGRDSLLLHKFKKDTKSVFRTRNYVFSPEDIKHPY
jgi:hypothetical protein